MDSVVTDPPAGVGIHGHAWDKASPDEFIAKMAAVLTEARRVIKPGGHILIWALPRTSHRTALALEQAGWDIRDVVTHLFGKGQSGSLDIGKAIDKAAGAKRASVGKSRNSRPRGKDRHGGVRGAYGYAPEFDITEPATKAAKRWDGWGTRLRPGSEHWILARAPLSEPTIAGNVIANGVGALNIDDCRNGSDFVDSRGVRGRWPANAVLSHSPECANDNCAPGCSTHELDERAQYFPCFYYCPKVSRSERGESNPHPTVKPIALMRWLCRLITPPGGTVLDPFAGTGSTGLACAAEGFHFFGIERQAEYFDIALRRIDAANDNNVTVCQGRHIAGPEVDHG